MGNIPVEVQILSAAPGPAFEFKRTLLGTVWSVSGKVVGTLREGADASGLGGGSTFDDVEGEHHLRVISGAAADRRTTPLEEAYAHFRLDRQGLPVSPATLRLYEHTIGRCECT